MLPGRDPKIVQRVEQRSVHDLVKSLRAAGDRVFRRHCKGVGDFPVMQDRPASSQPSHGLEMIAGRMGDAICKLLEIAK